MIVGTKRIEPRVRSMLRAHRARASSQVHREPPLERGCCQFSAFSAKPHCGACFSSAQDAPLFRRPLRADAYPLHPVPIACANATVARRDLAFFPHPIVAVTLSLSFPYNLPTRPPASSKTPLSHPWKDLPIRPHPSLRTEYALVPDQISPQLQSMVHGFVGRASAGEAQEDRIYEEEEESVSPEG
jgi:hypothetical protein